MNKKGKIELPLSKIIVYLLIILTFIVIIFLLVRWRNSGIGLIEYLMGLFR